jgi:Domain of unknown function (DUF4111)
MLLRDRVGTAASDYLDELVRRTENVISDRLAGIWLVGSAALGDFEPRRSDLDVQAIATGTLPEHALTGLAAELAHESLPCPARGLEFVLYSRGALLDPEGPAFQLNLNTGASMSGHLGLDPAAEPRFWFVIDVAIARDHAVPLTGPAQEAEWPELPRPMVARALGDALAWYASGGSSRAQVFLAACRAWAWAVDGVWKSKREAAEWARGRIPDTSVDIALASRRRASAPQLDRARLAAILELTHAALDEAAR